MYIIAYNIRMCVVAFQKKILQVTTGAKISKLSLLLILLPRLWKRKEREFQLFGVDLCKHHKKLLASSNNNELQESVDVIKDMIETKSWWDTVDLVASQGKHYHMDCNTTVAYGTVFSYWLYGANSS